MYTLLQYHLISKKEKGKEIPDVPADCDTQLFSIEQ